MSHATKPYYLFSFLPAFAYWYLESYYSLEIALTGGIIIGIFEILFEKKFFNHVHTLSKLNISLVIFLGGISLIAKEGIFFKLQPTFTGLALSSFLFLKKIKNQSLMLEMLKDFQQKSVLPDEIYKKIEWHMGLFLVLYSLFMIWVSLKQNTSTWLFWKTAGFYLTFFGFILIEFFYIRFSIRRLQ